MAKFPRLKKFFKVSLITILVLFLLLFILCSIFVVNPLESDYAQPLPSLLAPSWQAIVVIPNPGKFTEQSQQFIPWQQLQQHPQWKNFSETNLYKKATEEWQKIQTQQQQFQQRTGRKPGAILQHIIGREVVFAARQQTTGEPSFLFATRVSFLAKVAYCLIPYLPEQVRKKANIQWNATTQITTITLQRNGQMQTLFLLRERDVILVSNQEQALAQTQQVLSGTVEGLMTHAPRLQKSIEKNKAHIIGYFHSDKASLLAELEIKPKEAKLSLDGVLQQLPENFLMDNWFRGGRPATNYPEHLASYTTFSIPWHQIWQSRHENWPDQWLQFITPYTNYLDQRYGSRDFVAQWIQKNLQDEVLISIQRTDFDREGATPYSKYPNIALIIPTNSPDTLLADIESIANEVVKNYVRQNPNQQQIQFWFMEDYAAIPYIKIKFPDTTGGAIRPAIGVVGNDLVITTHTGFFKEWCDLYHRGGVAYQSKMLKEFQQRQAPIQFFLDGQCLGQIVSETNEQLAEEIALRQRSANFGQARAEWITRLKDIGLFLQILQPDLTLQFKNESNRIQSELVIHCGN